MAAPFVNRSSSIDGNRSPVSGSDATQSEGDDSTLYGETQPLDEAETQLVEGVDEEEGVAADWVETQLVESGDEDGGDDGEQLKTRLEVEREEEDDAGGTKDNAGDWTTTQLVEECVVEGANGGVDDMLETQLVEESEEVRINGGNEEGFGEWAKTQLVEDSDEEIDFGEWAKTQLVEDSDEEIGDNELSEGTLVLSDNEGLSDDERDAKSGMEGSIEGVNGRVEKHVDNKNLVDSDASTDEEGNTGHLQMKLTSVRVASVQTCGLAETRNTITVNSVHQGKQEASTYGKHLLPKIAANSTSCSTSFSDPPDCGIDNDSNGYVQNHDKDGIRSRDRCSTAKRLFADMTGEEGESNSRGFAGLSYIGSQEPGDKSQENAFELVDRLISINGRLLSQEATPNKLEIAKPPVSNKRGTLILAEKVERSRSSIGKAEIFEWLDSREDDGGGDFFRKNKDILLKKSAGRGKPKRHSLEAKKCSTKIASGVNKIGESKNKTNFKLCGGFETLPLSDSRLLKSDVKSKRVSGNRTKKNLLKDLVDLSNAKSLEGQQEKADVALHDVGPDTQIAVEAMEVLAQCSPAKTLSAKGQPLLDRDMIDDESTIIKCNSKSGPPQKRTSSIQEGVMTRSKRRKVIELNTKPKKERHGGLKMPENSELIGKIKRKQTKCVPEKSKVSKMFLDENKYHGTPVAHRTRHCSRNSVCEYTDLCSNKHLRVGKKLTGDSPIIGEVQNNHITNGPEKPMISERKTISGLSYFEKENTEHTFANNCQDLEQSRDGSTQHTSVNNVQNFEPRRGEPTNDVACRDPPSHPKQRRTPTRMVQSNATAVTQTAANHDGPRPHKKRRVFVRSVSDQLKYAKKEPSNGRSTSLLSNIIGKSLAASPILYPVRVDSRTSDFSSSGQRLKESSHVEDTIQSPKSNTQIQSSSLNTPSKVVNELSPTFSPVNPSKASNRSLSKPSVVKELLKLDLENVLSNQQQKDSRRRKDMSSFSILFSHHLDEDVIKCQKKILARLGLREAFSISDATHFVANSFFRTRNMLEALTLGKPVVTSMWLENCGQAGCFIDERKYILRDAKKEKELGFSMPISLASACKHPLLLGKRVFVTLNVKPSQEVVTSLVKASSGQPLERLGRSITNENEVPDDLLVISCEEDYQTCASLLERGASVFSSELVLNGIIIQKLEYERHRLFADRVKQTRSTRWLKDTVHGRFVPVSKCP
ncbi:uncharacterized protein LOC133928430 isoform X2 [Phragmites australis]|uniref:uncharacterized protein LOC133928430 isoform X2 n=1 Tax=Phragmites australis TaxID=29695 RepID=UPI002D783583|nr:uncharacterized protein LOC133928430 isoform X2 [Phragmites australis]